MCCTIRPANSTRLQRRLCQVLECKDGANLTVQQSNGGSGKQARAVIDGLGRRRTLALAYDIDAIAQKADLLPRTGRSVCRRQLARTRRRSSFSSARGTRKASRTGTISSKPGVAVITPNPKTSGGARWNFLAAWGYALRQRGGSDAKAQGLRRPTLYKNVPVLDSGARGSTTTFVERGIGDVLIAWENEAFLAVEELGRGKFEIVRPSLSILAEPPVALVDGVVDKHGTNEPSRRPTSSTSTRPKARDHCPPFLPSATCFGGQALCVAVPGDGDVHGPEVRRMG